jgi:hypothetical protein
MAIVQTLVSDKSLIGRDLRLSRSFVVDATPEYRQHNIGMCRIINDCDALIPGKPLADILDGILGSVGRSPRKTETF